MTLARRRTLALAALLPLVATVAVAIAARSADRATAPRAAGQRPPLALLTSLPLVFPESFGLAGGSVALSALETRYRVEPISVTDAPSLGRARLLLLAQPRAQPAEMLVALDRWVRGGGHVVLLADPMLEWPSTRPLGDPLRPPMMFADTGLLRRWGLRLDAPDDRGPAPRRLAGRTVATVSPGTLVGTGCTMGEDGFVAECRVGRGRATIIADADILNVDSGSPNLEALLAILADLESR